MSEQHLPSGARRIVRALIEVVKPRKPDFDIPAEDAMLGFLDEYYFHFPIHMKVLFPIGLYLLEYGTFIFAAKLKPFTGLSISEREQYVDGWVNSKIPIRRDLIKGVKGVCLAGFYAQPEVLDHIGYDIDAHLERVNKGEPCDPEVTEYFRSMGYDRNTNVAYPGFDHVDLITHDTPPPEGAAE